MNKLNTDLDNLKESALKQALRFILEPKDIQESISNIGFIKLQIEEFARMYPEFKPTTNEIKELEKKGYVSVKKIKDLLCKGE